MPASVENFPRRSHYPRVSSLFWREGKFLAKQRELQREKPRYRPGLSLIYEADRGDDLHAPRSVETIEASCFDLAPVAHLLQDALAVIGAGLPRPAPITHILLFPRTPFNTTFF